MCYQEVYLCFISPMLVTHLIRTYVMMYDYDVSKGLFRLYYHIMKAQTLHCMDTTK